jgi:PTH1 family peptidyl-tRNA hydrolase
MSEPEKIFLIVGLGNPGEKYAFTRHNIGFLVTDHLAKKWGSQSIWMKEHQALTYKLQQDQAKIILAKPQTFMNLSGESVQPLMSYYKVPLNQLLVVHDDLDIPFRTLKLVTNRGHGGQNGVRSIHERLGTPNYSRLKCGISRPPHPEWNVSDWVLSNWSPDESNALTDWLNEIEIGITAWIKFGLEKAANQINSRLRNKES